MNMKADIEWINKKSDDEEEAKYQLSEKIAQESNVPHQVFTMNRNLNCLERYYILTLIQSYRYFTWITKNYRIG